MQMLSPAEQKYKDTMIKAMAEIRRLFSNPNKPEREKMTCRGFLHCMNIKHNDAELIEADNPSFDVIFRQAKFEITEVVGERKRDSQLKKLETKYKNATASRDLFVPIENPEPMLFSEMVQVVRARLGEKFGKRKQQGCENIDALVHIDINNRYLDPVEFSTQAVFAIEAQGWRSASVLIVPYATVLFASDTAPEFLREHVGQVRRACDSMINRLFDA
jgi:hypothetical protein